MKVLIKREVGEVRETRRIKKGEVERGEEKEKQREEKWQGEERGKRRGRRAERHKAQMSRVLPLQETGSAGAAGPFRGRGAKGTWETDNVLGGRYELKSQYYHPAAVGKSNKKLSRKEVRV